MKHDAQNENRYTLERAKAYIEANRHNVSPVYRLGYHLMPEVGWMNDPNGFIYFTICSISTTLMSLYGGRCTGDTR